MWNPRLSFRMTESRIQNSLYALLKRQIHNSRVLNDGKQVSGFVWMQGERDARYPQAADAYLGNIRSLIYDLRREYNSPQAPFILGRINPPASHFPAVETLRRAQVEVARQVPLTRWVDADGLGKAADQIHYNTQGQILLGRRFAEAFRQVYRE
ncbi:MAG: sialate O-acetylesterase [Thiolinea sp.]